MHISPPAGHLRMVSVVTTSRCLAPRVVINWIATCLEPYIIAIKGVTASFTTVNNQLNESGLTIVHENNIFVYGKC